MSVYQLNKIFYLLDMDEDFLARTKKDPGGATKDFDLTDAERTALLNGDVGQLYKWGVHTFILNSAARHEVFGVNRENYLKRIRAAAEGK
jgi:hypothetical protein